MQLPAESDLIRQAQAEDRQAFAGLVDRYWGRVRRWLGRLTEASQADDLTQETFLRAWRALPTFLPGASFRAWVFGIARHALIDARRGPRGRPTAALSREHPSKERDPAEAVLDHEAATLLQTACDRLPEHFRSAFLLRVQEGMSFTEIAQVLGLTEATARWRVFKARLLLVEQLGPYLDEKTP